MGQDTRWPQRSEWLDDARGEARWCDLRTALAKFGDGEYLGKVRDLSLSGLSLALAAVRPRRGQRIEVAVVFERRVVEVSGTVTRVDPTPWGCLVGVECVTPPAETRRFLRERYAAPSALGSVK